jgi:predicted DNA-binding transcriptional regulator AlpA
MSFASAGIAGTDPLLNAEESAAEVHLALPTFWRQVKVGRMPKPVYPSPRAPRWWRSELHASLEQTRALPTEQMAARRAEKIAATQPQNS